MKLLKFQNWLFLHVQLEKAGLRKYLYIYIYIYIYIYFFFFSKTLTLREQKHSNILRRNLKLSFVMSLKCYGKQKLKLPTLARHHSNSLPMYFKTGSPGQKCGSNKLLWTGRIQESPEGETPVHMSYQPPRILLTGIHLGWAMFAPPVRTLSQNDWPETTQKLILLP